MNRFANNFKFGITVFFNYYSIYLGYTCLGHFSPRQTIKWCLNFGSMLILFFIEKIILIGCFNFV